MGAFAWCGGIVCFLWFLGTFMFRFNAREYTNFYGPSGWVRDTAEVCWILGFLMIFVTFGAAVCEFGFH